MDDTVYIRMDKGDEIISSILVVYKKDGIQSRKWNRVLGP